MISGLRLIVSAMRSERAQGSLPQRMDLVMRTRPMLVPGGQVTAELVAMAVSWNVCPSGREQPRVPTRPVTAAIPSQANGQADIARTGLPLRGRKGHRKGGSWPRRGGFLARKGLGRDYEGGFLPGRGPGRVQQGSRKGFLGGFLPQKS